MANTTLWRQAKTGDPEIQYGPLDDRQLIAAEYPSEGIVGDNSLKVSAPTAGMTVNVAAGAAIVACDKAEPDNSYFVSEDAQGSLVIPAAPSSGTRTHLIYELARDPQFDGQASYLSGSVVSADTGTGAPLLDSALLLAKVAVPHGTASITSAMITDMRGKAARPGEFLDRSIATSNTNSANAASYKEQLINHITFTLNRSAIVEIHYSHNGHSEGSNKANTIQATLRQQSGATSGTDTAGTIIDSSIGDISGAAVDVKVGDTVFVNLAAGTYTFSQTFMPRGGTGHQDGGVAPAWLFAKLGEWL